MDNALRCQPCELLLFLFLKNAVDDLGYSAIASYIAR